MSNQYACLYTLLYWFFYAYILSFISHHVNGNCTLSCCNIERTILNYWNHYKAGLLDCNLSVSLSVSLCDISPYNTAVCCMGISVLEITLYAVRLYNKVTSNFMQERVHTLTPTYHSSRFKCISLDLYCIIAHCFLCNCVLCTDVLKWLFIFPVTRFTLVRVVK